MSKQDKDLVGIKKMKEAKGISKWIIVVLVLIVLTILTLLIRVKMLNTKHPVVNDNLDTGVEIEGSEPLVDNNSNKDEMSTIDKPEVVEGVVYDYDNKLVGIKFNYATDMYIKENTDVIFNTLKSVAEEGKNFQIGSDKLSGVLKILQLTTGKTDGLLITVSILPFELSNKSLVSGELSIEKDKLSELPVITEPMLTEYDINLRKSLTELGVTIDVFEKSYIREVNGMKAIISERKYSGSIETKTGVTDVIQALVPVGENAILITAITDGSPIEIDKVSLFDEIVDSLVVTLTEEDTVVVPNNQ